MTGQADHAQRLPPAPVTAGQDAPGRVTAINGPQAAHRPHALARHAAAGDLAAGGR